jgi:hypothetical protein
LNNSLLLNNFRCRGRTLVRLRSLR